MNFKADAVEFVRLNNCANSTPVELIQKAMNYGAIKLGEKTLGELKLVIKDLDKRHKESAPHLEIRKPIEIQI